MMTKSALNILLFTIEILVAEFLFSHSLSKRESFLKRRIIYYLVIFLCAIISSFLPSEIFQNAIISSLIFLFIFAISIVFMCFCYNESLINVLFCGIAAYTTQHFAYQIANLVSTCALGVDNPVLGMYSGGSVSELLAFSKETLFWVLVYIFCFYVTYTLFYFLYAKKLNRFQSFQVENISLFLLVGVGLFVEIVLNSVYVYSTEQKTVTNGVTVCIYNCLCCILLLSMQFGLIRTKKLENELDFTRKLMIQQAENYKSNKKNIDLINIKCHDMRHQIREIGKNKFISQEAIDEIEKTINLYDSSVKTGNEILDTILTAKSLLCAENEISISCVVDGSTLKFMLDEEVYSLFGNALDNAIEAVMKIENKDERVIGVNLYATENFLTLNIYNTFRGQIHLHNGLPKTTKGDQSYHGFGVNSIKYIAEKYEGNLSISAKKGIFDLKILFSIPTIKKFENAK